MPYTLVSFHAHPDDEALLTAGTLARAAAEGHRVVLVVATVGEAGLAASADRADGALGERRLGELRRSAAALGCARVEWLGYADSGMADDPSGHPDAFADAEVDEAARRLAEILREEDADVLTVYDKAGGYGHPDHVQVHHVGVRAAELAGTPVVLEATVDRRALRRALRLISRLPGIPADFGPDRFATAYTAPEHLTHRVDVRRFAAHKRAAMAAHATQAGSDAGVRTLAVLLKLPMPLFRAALGREWFTERGRTPARPLLDDVFAGLRER
ncbi:PIG-L family deacetylase [Actinomadura rayongensis]|uniref:PIG-L family deacetylase n=1 Tax=Actinomadura rayongensis TaxID=1429076 RepID=A0A6I4WA63_9ACTN|nr:PIG-L family deacetylase [Actinomadura rayongensis]MXQ64956.1 PIG-L family deacetylase [Actinomadura rayongensis]